MPTNKSFHPTRTGPGLEIQEEELVYRVAEFAFERGLSATEILKRLMKEGYNISDHRVRDAMLKARKKCILIFQPPLCLQMAKDLAAKFAHSDESDPNATVFNDRIHFQDDRAFFTASAELLKDGIRQMLALPRNLNRERIVIANAGGPSVAETVRALGKATVEAEPRLLFISLSAVGKPGRFDLSPNYLSVRMAEIFSAHHYAPEDFANPGAEYAGLVGEIDMLVGGVGSVTTGFLSRELKARGRVLPEGTLGDIFYLPFASNGQPADTPAVRKMIKELHVHPTFEEFEKLRARKTLRLLIVPPPERAEAGAPPVNHKDRMVESALAHGLASHFMLYASMAERLLGTTNLKAAIG